MPVIADMPVMTPVTAECIKTVSEINKIPLKIIYAILKTEGGAVGFQNINANGSIDMGPMQINTIWDRHLKKLAVDTAELTNHGCKNIAIGVAILNRYITQKNDFWAGIGRYNASDKRPEIQIKYSDKVAKAAMLMTPQEQINILNSVNRLINDDD